MKSKSGQSLPLPWHVHAGRCNDFGTDPYPTKGVGHKPKLAHAISILHFGSAQKEAQETTKIHELSQFAVLNLRQTPPIPNPRYIAPECVRRRLKCSTRCFLSTTVGHRLSPIIHLHANSAFLSPTSAPPSSHTHPSAPSRYTHPPPAWSRTLRAQRPRAACSTRTRCRKHGCGPGGTYDIVSVSTYRSTRQQQEVWD